MISSLLTRFLLMVFGYAYPAYECFKAVEMEKPEIDQLLFWCQYWISVALLTVCERVGDFFISWLPLYGEAKLAFCIYLWYPRTRGSRFIYNSLLKPYVTKHEEEIDGYLLHMKNKTMTIATALGQRAASYGHKKFFEILQSASSHLSSTSAEPAQKIH